jgi:CheY-like chemotaxis protein
VRDTGVGIPSSALGSVFDMFAQLEPAAGRTHGGLGIGLTLAKRLVEMHGGSVSVHSEGRGRGSEFTVRLPWAMTAPSPVPVGEGTQPAELSCRIEVVDDNHDSADSLSMALAAMGAEVRTAYDGVEAVAVAREFRPDLIVMDIGMPRMDGCEAARRIRDLDNGRQVLLVALTGWNQAEDRQRTADAGFDYHFVKPFDPSVLGALLSERGA